MNSPFQKRYMGVTKKCLCAEILEYSSCKGNEYALKVPLLLCLGRTASPGSYVWDSTVGNTTHNKVNRLGNISVVYLFLRRRHLCQIEARKSISQQWFLNLKSKESDKLWVAVKEMLKLEVVERARVVLLNWSLHIIQCYFSSNKCKSTWVWSSHELGSRASSYLGSNELKL